MKRRDFLRAAATAAGGLGMVGTPAILRQARAQGTKWPDKPVKVIVPYAPGGATDAVARPWADKLGQVFGQQFVIENRGGASGMIGTEAGARAPTDGSTLLITPRATLTILPHLRKTPYDPMNSLIPIANVGDVVCGFVIHPAAGIKTFQEMVEFAKKNPGKLAFGSSGNGTATHLRLEMLKRKAGVDILHVPYRGGADTVADVLTNTVNMMNEPVSLPHVKAGKLTLLNVNFPTRSPDFPAIPTLTELGHKDADVPISFGLYGPAGLSAEIVAMLNIKMRELAATEELKKRLWNVAAIVPIETPEQMKASLSNDNRINAELIKSANIRVE